MILMVVIAVAIALAWCWDSCDEIAFELDCAYREHESAMFDVRWNCSGIEGW